MGIAHILQIYDDGLTTYNREKTKEAVGNAVISVCLERKRNAQVLGSINCVNKTAEMHSTDEQMFLWSRNCLRSLNELSDEEIENAKQIYDEYFHERKQHKD